AVPSCTSPVPRGLLNTWLHRLGGSPRGATELDASAALSNHRVRKETARMSPVKTCLGPALMRAPRAHLRRGDRPWPTGSRGAPPPPGERDQLPRCARVLREALRKSPPIYAFGRQALTNVTLGGHEIPAG